MNNAKSREPSGMDADNQDPFQGPPPAYSPRLDSQAPASAPPPPSTETETQHNFTHLVLLESDPDLPDGPRPYNTMQRNVRRPQESPEIMEQFLRLTSDFVQKIRAEYPNLRHRLAEATLTATLFVAPEEAVPVSSGWHLTQPSLQDNMLRGIVAQQARVHAPRALCAPGKDELQAGNAAGNWKLQDDSMPPTDLFSVGGALGALSTGRTRAVKTTRGMLWWDDEDRALRFIQSLSIRILELQRAEHVLKHPSRELAQLRLTVEETTFRRSTSMGLWESKSGWTIVMKVTIYESDREVISP